MLSRVFGGYVSPSRLVFCVVMLFYPFFVCLFFSLTHFNIFIKTMIFYVTMNKTYERIKTGRSSVLWWSCSTNLTASKTSDRWRWWWLPIGQVRPTVLTNMSMIEHNLWVFIPCIYIHVQMQAGTRETCDENRSENESNFYQGKLSFLCQLPWALGCLRQVADSSLSSSYLSIYMWPIRHARYFDAPHVT